MARMTSSCSLWHGFKMWRLNFSPGGTIIQFSSLHQIHHGSSHVFNYMLELLPHTEHCIKKCMYTVLFHLILKLYIVGLIIYNLYMRTLRTQFSSNSALNLYSISDFWFFGFLIHLTSSPDCKFLEGRCLVCFVHFFARAQISACSIFVTYCSILICWINKWMDALIWGTKERRIGGLNYNNTKSN